MVFTEPNGKKVEYVTEGKFGSESGARKNSKSNFEGVKEIFRNCKKSHSIEKFPLKIIVRKEYNHFRGYTNATARNTMHFVEHGKVPTSMMNGNGKNYYTIQVLDKKIFDKKSFRNIDVGDPGGLLVLTGIPRKYQKERYTKNDWRKYGLIQHYLVAKDNARPHFDFRNRTITLAPTNPRGKKELDSIKAYKKGIVPRFLQDPSQDLEMVQPIIKKKPGGEWFEYDAIPTSRPTNGGNGKKKKLAAFERFVEELETKFSFKKIKEGKEENTLSSETSINLIISLDSKSGLFEFEVIGSAGRIVFHKRNVNELSIRNARLEEYKRKRWKAGLIDERIAIKGRIKIHVNKRRKTIFISPIGST
jgi:hypothetical protein